MDDPKDAMQTVNASASNAVEPATLELYLTMATCAANRGELLQLLGNEAKAGYLKVNAHCCNFVALLLFLLCCC